MKENNMIIEKIDPKFRKWFFLVLRFNEKTTNRQLAWHLMRAHPWSKRTQLHAFFCGMLYTRLLFDSLAAEYDHTLPISVLNQFFEHVANLKSEPHFLREIIRSKYGEEDKEQALVIE